LVFFQSVLGGVVAAAVTFFLGVSATVFVVRFTAKGIGDIDLEKYLLAKIAKTCTNGCQFVSEFVVKGDFRFFNKDTIVYVGYSRSVSGQNYGRRHVVFFDLGRPTLLDRLISRPPGYRISRAFTYVIPDWARDDEFLIPTGHSRVDINNDGRDEFVVEFTSIFANRKSKCFGIFYTNEDSWEYLGSPDVRALISGSEELRDVAVYQETYELPDSSSARRIFAYSNGSMFAFGRPDADQASRLFLAVSCGHGEATLSPHRHLFLMLRCVAGQFVLDENWNQGRAFLADQPRPGLSEEDADTVIGEGYRKQDIGGIRFYKTPLFGKLKDLRTPTS